MKNFINLAFFLIALIIIFFMISSNEFYDVMSPVRRQVNEPIFISPGNVRPAVPTVPIIQATVLPRTPSTSSSDSEQEEQYRRPNSKHHSLGVRYSPNGSIVATSEFDVNVNYSKPSDKIDVESTGFRFERSGRKFTDGEELCCKILEEYLGRRVLNNFRPNFLKNPETKRNLELDLYDPLTKIGIEYQGIQHYEETEHFGATNEKVEKQKKHDALKIELCKKEGVKLIVVPCFVDAYTKDKKGKWKYAGYSKDIRYQKLYNFLVPILDNIFRRDSNSV